MNGHASCLRARFAHSQLSLILVGITLILVFLPTTSLAQDLDEVSFSGVVADENGAVIPGAQVTARPPTARGAIQKSCMYM